MSNLPSSCLWLPTEKGVLVLRLPGNPRDRCCPRLSCTLPYSCPAGCSETDPGASEGAGHSLSSRRFSAQAAAPADGLWRLNHEAHGSYCGLPIVKFKGSSMGSRLNWCGEPRLPYMNCWGRFLLMIALWVVRNIDH